MTKEKKPKPAPLEVSKGRLEFLFDGIFAIAMTLLVLELKVPEIEDRHSARELFAALGHHGPAYFSFLLSFGMLSMFWYNHQTTYRFIRRVSGGILVANLLMMATASAFPFCAALFGRYPTNAGVQLVYSACIFLHFIGAFFQWRLAVWQKALDPSMDQTIAARISKGTTVALCILGFLTLLYTVRLVTGS